ncbi:unnamed protein product [Lasius platythorax]|uniref:Uncharacterized protein n=1 Tax=Lasius platythorax TaxID=488582 RepID=A0AAV2N609_9HYME
MAYYDIVKPIKRNASKLPLSRVPLKPKRRSAWERERREGEDKNPLGFDRAGQSPDSLDIIKASSTDCRHLISQL